MLGMGDIMKQAQQMQENMQRMQEDLKKRTITADVGGGMVTVTANGANEILSIKIEKSVINPDEAEVLEDLIVAAVNRAMEQAGDMVASEMKKITGMLPKIPGLPF